MEKYNSCSSNHQPDDVFMGYDGTQWRFYGIHHGDTLSFASVCYRNIIGTATHPTKWNLGSQAAGVRQEGHVSLIYTQFH